MSTHALSMTGFGTGEAPCDGGVVRVEIRAVNHRGLDVRVRTSAELADLASQLEDLVRSDCQRGRIEVSLKLVQGTTSGRPIDLAPLRAAHAQLAALRDELMPGERISLEAVLRFAGEQRKGSAVDVDAHALPVRQAAREALDRLQDMRATEGAALGRDLRARVATLRNQVARIDGERAAQLEAYRERALTRVRKLLDGTGLEIDTARLTQEVAWLAERSDVAEELTRLASHLEQFEQAVGSADGSGVGRKLEFLVQEMGREVNTLGSKAADAATAHRVVDMKAELDRIREQVANVL